VKADIIWNVERGLALTAEDLMDAAVARARLDRDLARFFTAYDVLLAPTTQVLPFPAEDAWPKEVAGVPMQTYVEWMRSVSLVSATGLPAVSVPGGFADGGLPIGIQLVAGHGRDVELLRVARAYESVTRYAEREPDLTGGSA
jgi:amidase